MPVKIRSSWYNSLKAVAGGYVSEIVVGDKVTWMFGGDTYVFFVN